MNLWWNDTEASSRQWTFGQVITMILLFAPCASLIDGYTAGTFSRDPDSKSSKASLPDVAQLQQIPNSTARSPINQNMRARRHPSYIPRYVVRKHQVYLSLALKTAASTSMLNIPASTY